MRQTGTAKQFLEQPIRHVCVKRELPSSSWNGRFDACASNGKCQAVPVTADSTCGCQMGIAKQFLEPPVRRVCVKRELPSSSWNGRFDAGASNGKCQAVPGTADSTCGCQMGIAKQFLEPPVRRVCVKRELPSSSWNGRFDVYASNGKCQAVPGTADSTCGCQIGIAKQFLERLVRRVGVKRELPSSSWNGRLDVCASNGNCQAVPRTAASTYGH